MVDIQQDITVMGGREVSRPYRVWFFAEGERFLSFWRCHRPRKRAALVMWGGWFKPQLEIRHATALTTGAKHWHRRKAVFYVFCFCAPSIYPLNRCAQSLCDFRLHGVSHNAASPMPVAWFFLCGVGWCDYFWVKWEFCVFIVGENGGGYGWCGKK